MSDGPTPVPAPREQGWVRMALALAAFLLLPHLPGLPAFVPVIDTLLLLTPVLAACFVVGWWAGGPFSLAVVWTALTAWLYFLPAPSGVSLAYYDMARAWGLLTAGAFGLVCLAGRQRSFLERSLSGIGIAALLALVLLVFSGPSPRQTERIFANEFAARNAAAAVVMQESAQLIGTHAPRFAEMANQVAAERLNLQRTISRSAAPLFPALLGLEALAACALAWALYHRLSRARIGAALAPLSRFAFSDQLVWALVAGITMLLLPTLAAVGPMGWNITVFIGALYVLRGYGIYAWFTSQRVAAVSLVLAIAAFPLSLVTVPAALGLGLTDTWLDWRARLRIVRPGPGQKGPRD